MRPRGAWREPSKLNHYNSFPTALTARIIELTTDTGDLVMDPFAGSGVVLAQAAAMDRHYLGFEVNEEYIRMFEETVKDEVAAEWEEIKSRRKSLAGAKVDFEQVIMKLRTLKYTRQVTRAFLSVLKTKLQNQIQAILCIASIPRKYIRHTPFNIKVLIMVDRVIPEFETALKVARIRASRPPLTQYEIRSDIQVVTYSGLKRQDDLMNHTFYLYIHYKPRKYIARGSLKYWFENGRLKQIADDLKVPMLANIAVDVAWILNK